MTAFFTALSIFLVLHMLPTFPGVRPWLVAHMGRRVYLVIYSLTSLATLGWLFHAALQLDIVILWPTAPWQVWFPLILTPVAMVLLFAGLISPNPVSVTMRGSAGYPGAIMTITRHPVLWGFALWAGSHIVSNGDTRSLLLFGALLTFAILGMVMAEKRGKARLAAQWTEVTATTSLWPLAAICSRRAKLRMDRALLTSVALSCILTAWLLTGGHSALFGTAPLVLLGL